MSLCGTAAMITICIENQVHDTDTFIHGAVHLDGAISESSDA